MELACVALFENTSTTLGDVMGNSHALVVDFWNVRCTRCTEALRTMNNISQEWQGSSEIRFTSCALAITEDAGPNLEMAREHENATLEALTPLFMDFKAKEHAKRTFSFTTLPFCVVLDQDGTTLFAGDPNSPALVDTLQSIHLRSAIAE